MFATGNPSERRIRCFNIRRLMHGASVLLLELNAVRLSNMKFSVAAVILSGAVSFASRDVKAADLEISIPIQLSHSQNMDPSDSSRRRSPEKLRNLARSKSATLSILKNASVSFSTPMS